jgi:hypothetical protein
MFSRLVSILVRHLKIHSETLKHMKFTWCKFLQEKKNNEILSDMIPCLNRHRQVAENETEENAVLIAQTEVGCLDELSLEGDIPDDVSNMWYGIK